MYRIRIGEQPRIQPTYQLLPISASTVHVSSAAGAFAATATATAIDPATKAAAPPKLRKDEALLTFSDGSIAYYKKELLQQISFFRMRFVKQTNPDEGCVIDFKQLIQGTQSTQSTQGTQSTQSGLQITQSDLQMIIAFFIEKKHLSEILPDSLFNDSSVYEELEKIFRFFHPEPFQQHFDFIKNQLKDQLADSLSLENAEAIIEASQKKMKASETSSRADAAASQGAAAGSAAAADCRTFAASGAAAGNSSSKAEGEPWCLRVAKSLFQQSLLFSSKEEATAHFQLLRAQAVEMHANSKTIENLQEARCEADNRFQTELLDRRIADFTALLEGKKKAIQQLKNKTQIETAPKERLKRLITLYSDHSDPSIQEFVAQAKTELRAYQELILKTFINAEVDVAKKDVDELLAWIDGRQGFLLDHYSLTPVKNPSHLKYPFIHPLIQKEHPGGNFGYSLEDPGPWHLEEEIIRDIRGQLDKAKDHQGYTLPPRLICFKETTQAPAKEAEGLRAQLLPLLQRKDEWSEDDKKTFSDLLLKFNQWNELGLTSENLVFDGFSPYSTDIGKARLMRWNLLAVDSIPIEINFLTCHMYMEGSDSRITILVFKQAIKNFEERTKAVKTKEETLR